MIFAPQDAERTARLRFQRDVYARARNVPIGGAEGVERMMYDDRCTDGWMEDDVRLNRAGLGPQMTRAENVCLE